MFPSILYKQIQTGIHDFLKTTFPVSTPFFKGIIDRLFTEEDVLKGPYISLKLPFKTGKLSTNYFSHLEMDFTPYQHQELAFKRLSGEITHSTVISTGTGSGKTECFLYPILEHCCQQSKAGNKGIKAIIVYPMNALATDQAKRFAKTIWNNPNLRGNVRVGMYVGSQDEIPSQAMMPDKVITDKKTMQLDPPDILMTNYKMLDYLLIRPNDYPIWQCNTEDTFKYLVVDELHTFDGAQGTDLACLIRRLKARLHTREGYLCCIGTSATLGGKEDTRELLDYAMQVFGEQFDDYAVITESVLSYEEFFSGQDTEVKFYNIPAIEEQPRLEASNYESVQDYVEAQYQLWFEKTGNYKDIEHQLSVELKQHDFFRKIIMILGNDVLSMYEISDQLEKILLGFDVLDKTQKENLLSSMLALVSIAKKTDDSSFLSLRVQYWIRELRRIVSEVQSEPNIHFSDDLTNEELQRQLPIIHCRECGAMGWGGTSKSGDSQINPDLQLFYLSFFHKQTSLKFLFPVDEDFKGIPRQPIMYLCGNCLNVIDDITEVKCPHCNTHDRLIKVQIPDNLKKIGDNKIISSTDCPYCEAQNSLTIIGSRAASLISIIISQLFASPYNEDKKLIAFSDSVQDASHRAGYFSARTYRFNFRSAIQQFIDSDPSVKTLSSVSKEFIDFYWNEFGMKKFITTFIPNNMLWMEDFEYFKQTGNVPDNSLLISKIKKRIEWEIISEFGFNSRIGRTLEKTGSSTAAVEMTLVQKAAENLLEPLRNIGELRAITLDEVWKLLLGMLYRLKSGGGIYYPELIAYINSYGTTYLINQIDYMPSFQKNSRAPRFLTTNSRGRFDRIYGSGKTTWHEQWTIKVLGSFDQLLESYTPDIVKEVINQLNNVGILKLHSSHGHSIWSLAPEAMQIAKEVMQMRCDKCGYQVSVNSKELEVWNGLTCIRYNCHGHYKIEPESENYYGKLYKNADIQRIYAEEHTGLLERQVRERVESSFINQNLAWNPNLLSCTPTLEMGIDIGDLSSLILCSIPPTTSSYLQRIGRSGRRDGNSFNIAVANAHPHDLYFYENPHEMISGKIQTPGCLIDAPAILERQFTAYCFDRWIETGVTSLQLPAKLAAALASLEKKALQTFPYNFTYFIQNNKSELFKGFIEIFKDDLSEDAIKSLWSYIDSNSVRTDNLVYRIHNAFWEINKEVESLKKRVKKISREINIRKAKKAKDQNFKTEMSELLAEKTALNSIIKHIRSKNIFNFFTDEGLLPNYAFPQAGIILRSIILKQKPKEDPNGSFKSQIFEYSRPSSMAIKELAPHNKFYAEGRKVEINQINLNLSELEEWIFCANCSYIEKAVLNKDKVCPKCGNDIWSDPGQKQKMIKMKQVTATTTDRKSRSWDETEDREPEFYNKKIIPHVEQDQITHAFQLQDLPFGFEFIKKAEFREVNFGNLNEIGQLMMIGGRELPVSGFKICSGCGKVYPHSGDFKHDITCKYKGKDDESVFINSPFLYREFISEAIRILMPITSEALNEKKLHSFIAGLYLGLKLKFKGNIDHLQTTVQEMPNDPDSGIKKNYLILYDTIPGGTGYLKQLMKTSEDLVEVFELALNFLKACKCQKDEKKDGCYQCIYAYRFNYQRPDISRDTAIKLFEEIVSKKHQFITIKTIDEISTNTLIESELEALFIHTLQQYSKSQISMKMQVVNGKPGWFIKINDLGYYIEPQVELGLNEGVVIPSRADFVFYPEKDMPEQKPIVVFTDGYLFHGHPENAKGQLGKDMSQRMAIQRSGKYDVWSLSWNDIKNYDKKSMNSKRFIESDKKLLTEFMQKINNSPEFLQFRNHYNINNFELFMIFLEKPERHLWQKYSAALIVTELFSQKNETTLDAIEDFGDNLVNQITLEDADWNIPGNVKYYHNRLKYNDGNDVMQNLAYWERPVKDRQDLLNVKLICRVFDENVKQQADWQSVWNEFLHFSNIFQFVHNPYFITTLGIANGNYAALEETVFPQEPEDEKTKTILADILALIDQKYHGIIIGIVKANITLPEIGFEYMKDSAIVAQAEMAWPTKKIVLLHKTDYKYEDIFLEDNWKIIKLDDFLQDITANLERLSIFMNE